MARPILMLHGAIGSAAQLQPFREAFGDAEVLLPDLPGHGPLSAIDTNFSIPDFARHLKEMLNGQPVDIVGYSMGGYIGLYMALHFPELVGRVVSIAAKLHWTPEIADAETRQLDAGKIAQKVPAFAQALEARHRPGDWRKVLAATAEMMVSLGRHPAMGPDDFAKIGQPVLLLSGDRDKMVTPEETLAAYRHFGQAQLGIVPGMPHPIEQADFTLLSTLIRRFFS